MKAPIVTVEELSQELKGAERPVLLDVREAHELKYSKIEPYVLIPLGELADRFKELDPSSPIVVICRTGNRSDTATTFLISQGFASVRNLEGGMNEWVDKIDPSMDKY